MTYAELPSWAKDVYRTTKKNAGQRGIEFSIEREDWATFVTKHDGRCAITGLPFDTTTAAAAKHQRRPFFPSVDRRDCGRGYQVDNVRLVCIAVNLAINTWGEEVLHLIARALTKTLKPTDARVIVGRLRGVQPVVSASGIIRYRTKVQKDGKRKHIGIFDDPVEARHAYIAQKQSR